MRNEGEHSLAWVATVDMGFGHGRAVFPFRNFAEQGIIAINESACTAQEEKRLWRKLIRLYEFFSRASSVPLVGKPLFFLLDMLQAIPELDAKRNIARPGMQVRLVKKGIGMGLSRGLLEKIVEKPLPLLTSYMTPAIAADGARFEKIFCIICDAEVSRAWVPESPQTSRIHYLVPCERTVLRLKRYGVPENRISLTGFPLPQELLGGEGLDTLRADFSRRLLRLDHSGVFSRKHSQEIAGLLGRAREKRKTPDVLRISYAVGGAGAQKEIGAQIAKSLSQEILKGTVELNLVAGVRTEVREFFAKVKQKYAPSCESLRIVYSSSKQEYFAAFSALMRKTDILWTKPSELSFYCGLGLPLILTPSLGAQERYNRKWLLHIGAAIPQQDPRLTHRWLFDMRRNGRFAELAWNGFKKVEKRGTYNILNILRADGKLLTKN
jgi:hypothetical protein